MAKRIGRPRTTEQRSEMSRAVPLTAPDRSWLRAELLGLVPERPESGDWQAFGCLLQNLILGRAGVTGFRQACAALAVPRDYECTVHARRLPSPAPRPRYRRGAARVRREEKNLHARRLRVRAAQRSGPRPSAKRWGGTEILLEVV